MSSARVPGSLRRPAAKPANAAKFKRDTTTTGIFTAACLAAASPATIALAQGTPSGPLPPLSVEAKQPKKQATPAPAKKAGTAAPVAAPAPALTPAQKSANPYANPNAPYKVEQSASPKLTEPLVNTPKTITVVPKEVLQDTATTTIRELAREIPGVTLGFAEGGNAFGDRIYIRGFDARGDIYVDNIRDPGNTSRETFAVEQIEVYKGPTGVVAGRGTAGGALNIITKKPYDDRNFYNLSTMFGTDGTRRVTADVNQVITPGIAFRGNLLYHESGVAGRNEVEDERWGGAFALAIKPSENFKVTIDYYRLRTDGLPDFGVPLNINAKVPWPETGLPRDLVVRQCHARLHEERVRHPHHHGRAEAERRCEGDEPDASGHQLHRLHRLGSDGNQRAQCDDEQPAALPGGGPGGEPDRRHPEVLDGGVASHGRRRRGGEQGGDRPLLLYGLGGSDAAAFQPQPLSRAAESRRSTMSDRERGPTTPRSAPSPATSWIR